MKSPVMIAVFATLVGLSCATVPVDAAAEKKPRLNKGNTDSMTANTALITTSERDAMEYRFSIEGSYGENTTTEDDGTENTEKTAQNAKATANIKRTFGRPYVYSDNSIFHDKIGGIDYRVIAGLGGGTHVIDNGKDKLGLEAGLAYIFEKFESGADNDSKTVRAALRYDHAFSETATWWASVECLPNIDDFGDYLLNGEIGTETVLNGTLNLRLVAQDRYDSTPPDDLDRNDLSVIAALVYKL